jgi:DNA-binding response OmpR family regulator
MIEQAGVELEPSRQEEFRPRLVLIVDDDDDQSQALAWRLQGQGFATLTADRGARGLALARCERPDVVLLDLDLPDIDGLSICEQLADGPETCGIPVIIVSGHERRDVVRRARGAGCSFYLRKPYDPSVLLMLVEQALARSKDW